MSRPPPVTICPLVRVMRRSSASAWPGGRNGRQQRPPERGDNGVAMTKNELRKLARSRREDMDPAVILQAGSTIAERIAALDAYGPSARIGVYMAVGKEVPTTGL